LVVRAYNECTPTRRARPKSVLGAEACVALMLVHDLDPEAPDAYRYVRSASDVAAKLSFDPADGGKQAR
jgi:hypothetical protein